MKGSFLSFALCVFNVVLAGAVPEAKNVVRPTPVSVSPIPPLTVTTPPSSSTSLPPSCVNTPGSTVRVTKTLAFEDVDSLAASRVPIPDAYQGFSHSDSANNKIYRSGPPPVSISSPNVLYANNGRLALGAVGFPWNPQWFYLLTFLDPENGISSARVRISGVLVQPFEVTVTTDRAFVRIDFPAFDRITAVNIVIEVFAGNSQTQTLPFWVDDFVYVRREWQTTCCQFNNPNKAKKLTFDDLRRRNSLQTYKDFTFAPKRELSVVAAPVNNPSKPNAVYKKASANPLIITYSPGVFNLLSFTLTISQYSAPPFTTKQTRILVTGYDSANSQIGSWDIPAATYQPGTYSISLGGNWQIGNTGGLYVKGRVGGGGKSGFFSSGGFRSVKSVQIQVSEDDYSGNGGQRASSVPKAFWVDDFVYQKPAGCEEDF